MAERHRRTSSAQIRMVGGRLALVPVIRFYLKLGVCPRTLRTWKSWSTAQEGPEGGWGSELPEGSPWTLSAIREAMGGSKGSNSKVAFRAHSVEKLPFQSSSVWSWKGWLAGPAALWGAVDRSWRQKPLPGRQALLETCLPLLQAESLCVHKCMLLENTEFQPSFPSSW